MRALCRVSCFAGVTLCLMAQVGADDKPTSLLDAQAAIESNLRTSEGKAYDEQLGREFMEKHLATMRKCKQSAGKPLPGNWPVSGCRAFAYRHGRAGRPKFWIAEPAH